MACSNHFIADMVRRGYFLLIPNRILAELHFQCHLSACNRSSSSRPGRLIQIILNKYSWRLSRNSILKLEVGRCSKDRKPINQSNHKIRKGKRKNLLPTFLGTSLHLLEACKNRLCTGMGSKTSTRRGVKSKEESKMKYVGSIDQGTTSSRFIVFNEAGEMLAVDQMEHKQIMPRQGLVEHDASEIWENTKKVIAGALAKAKLNGSDLAAIGVTNQRETTVVWSRSTGKPLYNAIVWMDTRAHDVCKEIIATAGGRDGLQAKTGLPIVPYFAGTKLRWLIENVPEVSKAIEDGDALFGTIDTWLMWNLSGRKCHFTDVTNASRTLLMDIKTLNWDDELCEIVGVPREILPKIVSSSEEMFQIQTPECVAKVPLAGVLGDQQAALFGQTCFLAGQAKNTYGTGCFLLLNTGEEPVQSTKGLLTTVAFKIGSEKPMYALEGSVAIGGALVQWLRDNLGIIQSAPEVETLANTVPDSGGIVFVPAFSGLYAPYWREDARGVIVGMTRFTNRGHIARATLEAVAFQVCDMFAAMEEDSKVKLNSLRVDGGMVANKTLMQFQADMLNSQVIKPKITETTALGAAYAAGLAVGVWKNLEALTKNWSIDKVFDPKMEDEKRQKLFDDWHKAIERTYDWVD